MTPSYLNKKVDFVQEELEEEDDESSDYETDSDNSTDHYTRPLKDNSYQNEAYWNLPEQVRLAIDKAQQKIQKHGKT